MKTKIAASAFLSRAVKKLLFVPVLLLLLLPAVQAQDVFSVGPALHYNFGQKQPKVSWGIEAALWWYKDGFPISGNLGFEHRKNSTILYTQAQTGIALAGVSAGPYLEFKKDEATVKLGLQTDYWINYFVGLNYRIRYNGAGKEKALGMYLKAPIGLGLEDNDADDDFDWDWDWD
ncbi:hypothetical protein [Pontibacter chitinilyticus]|uniref:hypothetical protein n=1 Tax=Pontibacter chitinilyticus TaxID=2674989 RepID=UPI00321BEC08